MFNGDLLAPPCLATNPFLKIPIPTTWILLLARKRTWASSCNKKDWFWGFETLALTCIWNSNIPILRTRLWADGEDENDDWENDGEGDGGSHDFVRVYACFLKYVLSLYMARWVVTITETDGVIAQQRAMSRNFNCFVRNFNCFVAGIFPDWTVS